MDATPSSASRRAVLREQATADRGPRSAPRRGARRATSSPLREVSGARSSLVALPGVRAPGRRGVGGATPPPWSGCSRGRSSTAGPAGGDGLARTAPARRDRDTDAPDVAPSTTCACDGRARAGPPRPARRAATPRAGLSVRNESRPDAPARAGRPAAEAPPAAGIQAHRRSASGARRGRAARNAPGSTPWSSCRVRACAGRRAGRHPPRLRSTARRGAGHRPASRGASTCPTGCAVHPGRDRDPVEDSGARRGGLDPPLVGQLILVPVRDGLAGCGPGERPPGARRAAGRARRRRPSTTARARGPWLDLPPASPPRRRATASRSSATAWTPSARAGRHRRVPRWCGRPVRRSPTPASPTPATAWPRVDPGRARADARTGLGLSGAPGAWTPSAALVPRPDPVDS